ncbi:MAG: PIN domain-containing protein [Armatimonadetes bacterium]|nr:PIN domain-containing protein [Armatimonadota bacterium]
MAKGLDTTFLVEAEVVGHPAHAESRGLLHELIGGQEPLALTPQVLAEFVHVVTDPRRFEHPLEIGQALTRAALWWEGSEITHVLPSAESTDLFLRWMAEHQLGRKRLLDTQLAATYYCAGIRTIVTTNARDYTVFGCFTLIQP